MEGKEDRIQSIDPLLLETVGIVPLSSFVPQLEEPSCQKACHCFYVDRLKPNRPRAVASRLARRGALADMAGMAV